MVSHSSAFAWRLVESVMAIRPRWRIAKAVTKMRGFDFESNSKLVPGHHKVKQGWT